MAGRTGRFPVISRKDLANVSLMVSQGLEPSDIAERLGVTLDSLSSRCRRAGVSLKRGPGRPKIVREASPVFAPATACIKLEVLVTPDTYGKLRVASTGRRVSPAQLASLLIEAIANDSLFEAVLDS